MQQVPQPVYAQPNNRSSGLFLTRLFASIVVLVFVFAAGVAVGQGRIQFMADKQVAKGLPENLDYATVEELYDKLRVGYDGQLDKEKLLDGLKSGLAQASGDPYTAYLNVKDAEEFNQQLSGTFSGIGAELGKDDNNNIIVISPLAGYPAEKAGLRAKDIIAEIDGTTTLGMATDQAVSKIRGEAGTKVKLKLIRANTQSLDIEITRAEIKIPSVNHSVLPENIGYLQITRFGDDTVELASRAAAEFKEKNVKGVILDLRYDPGGLLGAAVSVSGMWLEKDQVVLQEKRGGEVIKTFNGANNPILKGVPTVVLINEGSASASEITAGALRDNKVATLIGTKTFGKGSVQQLTDLGDGSILKVTTAHWFTPNGTGIDKKGISPDQEVKLSDEDARAGKDPQKQAAIDFLNK